MTQPTVSNAHQPGVPDSLQQLLHPIAELSPYPGNPRRGNLDVLVQSLAAHGQYRPIVANRRTNQVLAGNHTLQAAQRLGWQQLAVTWVDVDQDQAARIVLVDNRANDLAGYDDEALAELLQGLPNLDGTGFGSADLSDLLASIGGPGGRTDPDDAPDLPATEPLCSVGDLWLLGPHRLAVGDSTDPAVIERLMGSISATADLLLTDPPYGVSYVGAGGQKIQNDELRDDDLQRLLLNAFLRATEHLRPGAPFYVFGPSHEQQTAFRLALRGAGLQLRSELVWVKSSIVLGRSDYQPKHESILTGDRPLKDDEADHDVVLYGWQQGAAHLWRGGRKQSSVWEFPKPRSSKDHPTMKPVAMLEQAIANSTPGAGIVLDLFAGSGSTLIACHGTGRLGRVVELDRRYAHVICRRYQEHTGTVPVLDGTGSVSFLESP